MHEACIARDLYRAAREAVPDCDGARIEKVRVRVGALAAVDPGLLRYAWQAVVQESADPRAELEILWCPVKFHCPDCGEDKRQGIGSWLEACPDCGRSVMVTGGEELDVLEVRCAAAESRELQLS